MIGGWWVGRVMWGERVCVYNIITTKTMSSRGSLGDVHAMMSVLECVITCVSAAHRRVPLLHHGTSATAVDVLSPRGCFCRRSRRRPRHCRLCLLPPAEHELQLARLHEGEETLDLVCEVRGDHLSPQLIQLAAGAVLWQRHRRTVQHLLEEADCGRCA